MKKTILLCSLILSLPTFATTGGNDYTQAIQVSNLAANTTIENPGMTPTAIEVKYFNGGSKPCWTAKINYRDQDTIHAGPSQGCKAKVERIEITPLLVAEKLETYKPTAINIDTAVYSSQIIVSQDADFNKAPVFDSQSGLVTTPGELSVKIQSQFK